MAIVSDVKSRFTRVGEFVHAHEDVLWYLHSTWALLFGCTMMWLGSKHHGLLRLAVFQIAFLWIASLIVPVLLNRPEGTSKWANRSRLVLNYLSKDFYQAMLFGALPFYFRSASWSWNMLFVVFLAASALLSTFDIVYDRVISAKRSLLAIFFAFNLFATVNLMLPILWGMRTTSAMRVSVALAVVGFSTVLLGHQRLRGRQVWRLIGVAAVVLMVFAEFFRPLVPPAPLRLVSSTFGLGVDRTAKSITSPVDRLDPGWTGRVYAMTPIYAPNGLKDRVAQFWYLNGKLMYTPRFVALTGSGLERGWRLWMSASLKDAPQGQITVEVRTEGGQMIGRAKIPVEPAPASF